MQSPDLFTWWVISISFSIVFLTIVSIYLYANRTCERTKGNRKANAASFVKNFVFVWVLLSLLVFYIVTVNIGFAEQVNAGSSELSAALFATGNIVVEVILVAYLLKNRKERTKQPNNQTTKHPKLTKT